MPSPLTPGRPGVGACKQGVSYPIRPVPSGKDKKGETGDFGPRIQEIRPSDCGFPDWFGRQICTLMSITEGAMKTLLTTLAVVAMAAGAGCHRQADVEKVPVGTEV